MKIVTSLRSTMAQSMLSALANGTTSAPQIEMYDGTMPDNIGDTITGTLLAEFDMTNTVGTESNGVITFDAIASDSSANATGTATWARLLDRDSAEVLYLTVSGVGAGGEIQLSNTAITAGEPVTITSGTITVGA